MKEQDTRYPLLTQMDAALRAPRSVHLKRKDGAGRMPHDEYITDYGTIERCLGMIRDLNPARVLDLGAGSGRWGEVARQMWPKAFITGVEIREVEKPESYNCWVCGSWPECADQIRLQYDLIMGNPPYARTEEFVYEGLRFLRGGGYLAFLLRLAFLEGQGRRDGLFKEYPPYKIAVCSKRPSFDESGKTNATAFACFFWFAGYQGETHVKWL